MKLFALLLLLAAQGEDPVHLTLSTDKESYSPGDSGTVVIQIKIEETFHIYGPKSGTATKIVPQAAGGIQWGEPEFPEPIEKDYPQLGGKLKLFEGTTEVRVPFTVGPEQEDPIDAVFLVDYLACTESLCLMPVKEKRFEVRIAVDTPWALGIPGLGPLEDPVDRGA